jgi:hypothetical protein
VCAGTMWNDRAVLRATPPPRRTATAAEVLAVRNGSPARRPDRLGMTLVGSVRDGGFIVYAHLERIDLEG